MIRIIFIIFLCAPLSGCGIWIMGCTVSQKTHGICDG